MTPAQIRELVLSEFPDLEPTKRSDGWAFYKRGVAHGRVFRALEAGARGSRLKLAVSDRLNPDPHNTFVFDGSADTLREYIRQELRLLDGQSQTPVRSVATSETALPASDAVPAFKAGQIYDRRTDLHEPYGGTWQGGIAVSGHAPVIFLFTGSSGERYGYRDHFDSDGVLYFTGEGQRGDMVFARGNLALRDHSLTGKAVHVFETLGKGKGQRYVGEFVCEDYQTMDGMDVDGAKRQIIIFHLVPINAIDIPGEQGSQEKAGLTLAELRQSALAASKGVVAGPGGKQAVRMVYERSKAVREYVLERAEGRCELCESAAPFLRVDGTPYLEPHHTTRVSDGGPDHPRFVGALCPSCHREVHFGAEAVKKNRVLQERLLALEPSQN